MAELPIPGSIYLSDFPSERFQVMRNNSLVTEINGVSNFEHGRHYVHFPLNSDIKVGDTMILEGISRKATEIDTDTYLGKPELMKVYL